MTQTDPARTRPPRRRLALAAGALGLTMALCAVPAAAHLERPSYWPNPAPDRSVSPPAGGKVPSARSLFSAATGSGPGKVRVVCKGASAGKSLALAKRSIRRARTRGFRLRPSQPVRRYGAGKAKRMLAINEALARRCNFHSVQKAINRSGNNDRVVIMPGRYTEPKSRRAPTNDPRCNPDLLQQDQTANQAGDPANTPSYAYQAKCSNDQNLIYVQGRAVKGDPLASPRPDRHGIPKQELGRCVRCNLQIDGSGPRPEDVILDAGKGYRKPALAKSRPGVTKSDCTVDPETDKSPCYAKHVVLRADRADGFVARNILMRGALEHGFYTEETDGVLLNRTKFFWAADYGHLSFTTDHNMVKNCDGFGSGDAVVYPGAAPQTGDFRKQSFYPKSRYNTVIKRCDLHGSAMGYSGSMGNSVRVTRNHFYGNANGLTSDTLSAPGHPGYPADGMKIDHNWFYSNNLNLYTDDPPVTPLVPQPVGTGMLWAGYNDGNVSRNYFFDNWRHGAVLHVVPDAVAGTPDGNVDSQIHCDLTIPGVDLASTSCANRFHHNKMGQVPPKFKKHPGLRMFGNKTTLTSGGRAPRPNGVDFWWDEFITNTDNCWYANEGYDGTAATITSGAGTPPDFLPSSCDNTAGTVDAIKIGQLLDCSTWERGNTSDDHLACYWFQSPPKPESPEARAQQRRQLDEARAWLRTENGRALESRLNEIADQVEPVRDSR